MPGDDTLAVQMGHELRPSTQTAVAYAARCLTNVRHSVLANLGGRDPVGLDAFRLSILRHHPRARRSSKDYAIQNWSPARMK